MECVRRFLRVVENQQQQGCDLKSPSNTSDIDEYLRFIARTGKTHVPWKKLKNVLTSRVSKVIDDFYEDQCNQKEPEAFHSELAKCLGTKERIIQCLSEFEGIPFTIQRIAELLVEPRKNYKRVDKFLRAVEKNVMVITTIDPLGNRIVTDSQQSQANAWSENLFPPPSPSSRVRRMSVDELVDSSSSVASPQVVAAAMMPPPPSPPPFSPKQQKSPLPLDNNVDVVCETPVLNNNASRNCEKIEEDVHEDSSIFDSTALKASPKKPCIVWHAEHLNKAGAVQGTSISPSSANEQASQISDRGSPDVLDSANERLQSDQSPSKVEPLPKRQRFNDDGCDCDSTTPDGDNSTPSSVALSTVT